MKSDGIILTYEELQILLFNLGYRQVEGIEMPESIFDEEKILRTMQKMARSGLISVKGDLFSVREDLRETLDIIGNPITTFRLDYGAGRPAFFVYASYGTVVITQLYEKKAGCMRIRTFEAGQYADWKEEMDRDYC